jgi:hypothetical protein
MESARRLLDHLLVGKHVAGDRKAFAGDRAGPVDTLRAGVLANTPRGVDHVELPMFAPLVRRNEPLHHLGCS